MSKIINIWTMVGLLTLLLSCEKVKDAGTDIDLQGTTSLRASVEDILIPGAEASLWSQGDRIGIFASGKGQNVPWVMKKDGAGAAEAIFYGEKVQGDLIRAYYPFEQGLAAEISSLPCDLSSRQVFHAGEAAPQVFLRHNTRCFATLHNGILHFAYPFGMLQIEVQLEGEMKIMSIGLSSDAALSGRFEVDNAGQLNKTASSASRIDLVLPQEGVSTRNGGNYTPFCLVLPPGEYDNIDLDIVPEEGNPLNVHLNGITVPRVGQDAFYVASVAVKAGGIPELKPETGYLEVL